MQAASPGAGPWAAAMQAQVQLFAAEMQATAYCGASLYGNGRRHLYGGWQRRVRGVDAVDIGRQGDCASINGLHILLQAAGRCVK